VTPVKRPLALALAAAAAACNTGFEPQYRVTELRILAVRAALVPVVEPPRADVEPGETVRFEALVANPLGRAPLTVSFYACAPAASEASLPPCLDPEVLKDPAALATTPGVLLLGRDVLAAGDGDEAAVDYTVPDGAEVASVIDAVIQRAVAEPTYRCSLYAEVPVVVVAEAGGRTEVAVKRVRVTPPAAELAPYPELQDAYVANVNPRRPLVFRAPPFEGRCDERTPLASGPYPMGLTELCGTPPDEPQRYNVCGTAGVESSTPETRSWQWFVTAGTFPDSDGIGNTTESTPEFERPPGPFTLWLVLRDGRGGVSWTAHDVAAAP